MKKILSVIVVCIMTAGMLAGCSSTQDVAIQTMHEEKIQLSFLGFKTGPTKIEEMETLLNAYMDLHPEVVITYEGISENYSEIMKNRIESGYADDIFMIHPSDFSTIEANGWIGSKIYDLSNEPFINRYNDITKKLITVNGKISGAPMCMSVIGLAANMDILNKCGVDKIPETYSEWLESMKIIKANGYVPMADYLGNDASPMFLMAARSIAPYTLNEVNIRESDTAERIFSKGIYDIAELMDSGFISREQLLANQDKRAYQTVLKDQFAKGESAYAVFPSWGIESFLAGSPDFEFKLTGLPLGDTGSVAMIRASVPVGINNESPNKEEALKFLDFMMHGENIESYAAGQYSVSPLKDADTKDEMFAQLLLLIEDGKALADTNPDIPFNLVESLNTSTLELAQGKTPEEVVDRFIKNIK